MMQLQFPQHAPICRQGFRCNRNPRGQDARLVTQMVTDQLPAVPLSCNNFRQVVHTHVPLTSSSINWYQSKADDVLRLGR